MMSLIWGKNTQNDLFSIKNVIVDWIFFFLPFITVLDMLKIRNKIGFNALLV